MSGLCEAAERWAGGGRGSDINAIMDSTDGKTYGTLTLDKGGLYAKRPARAKAPSYADWQLDDEMLAAFEGWHGEDGTVPSRAVYDIRMGQQKPWRYLAKRFREARAANVPKDQVIAVVKTLELFVGELYESPHRGRAA